MIAYFLLASAFRLCSTEFLSKVLHFLRTTKYKARSPRTKVRVSQVVDNCIQTMNYVPNISLTSLALSHDRPKIKLEKKYILNYSTLENIWQKMHFGSSQWNRDCSAMQKKNASTYGVDWKQRYIATIWYQERKPFSSSYDVIGVNRKCCIFWYTMYCCPLWSRMHGKLLVSNLTPKLVSFQNRSSFGTWPNSINHKERLRRDQLLPNRRCGQKEALFLSNALGQHFHGRFRWTGAERGTDVAVGRDGYVP
jgi:hypothetical protein